MTHGEISKMPAGRKMDEIIARKIIKIEPYATIVSPSTGNLREVWMGRDYSTDILSAWEVVDKMHYFELFKGDDYWSVAYYDGRFYDRVDAETAPLAICRAALLSPATEVDRGKKHTYVNQYFAGATLKVGRWEELTPWTDEGKAKSESDCYPEPTRIRTSTEGSVNSYRDLIDAFVFAAIGLIGGICIGIEIGKFLMG